MPHKMMPISMAKHNWAGRQTRQTGKTGMTAESLRKPENRKKQIQDFVGGRR